MGEFVIREAAKEDVPLLLEFIKELAAYENLSDQVTATEETLTEWIFNKGKAEAVIGEENGKPVGYALLYYNISSFAGRAGLFIEDIYLKPAHRKKGYGKAFFKYIAQLCVERGCARLEWTCLNWNKPSIDFYLSMGAQPLGDWTLYKLTEASIIKLAEG